MTSLTHPKRMQNLQGLEKVAATPLHFLLIYFEKLKKMLPNPGTFEQAH